MELMHANECHRTNIKCMNKYESPYMFCKQNVTVLDYDIGGQ